jgi:enamine deaminase RidA (YjgF/YER057c/UK114 family)
MAKLRAHVSARARTGLNASLQVAYPRLADIQRQPLQWWQEVLALIRFDSHSRPQAAVLPACDGIPIAEVETPMLGITQGAAEVWRLSGPLQSGTQGRIRYRHNGRLLFASLSLPEGEFAEPGVADAAQALRSATQSGYRELFSTLDHLGFAHLLRIWNFLPAINEQSGDGERYWHFNRARQDVFLDCDRCIAGNVPAATAVGADAATPLTLYCIASASAPISLENPRQRSAWTYPTQYGPRSPTFARACIEGDDAQTLFISGTASIVGHESAHAGDPLEQTRETLRNISAVVEAANRRLGVERFSLRDLIYKVYVRRPSDQPLIERELRQVVGAEPAAMYLQADICRRDLLVEIEAVGTRA